jgi:hypothetical protein
MSLVLSKFNEKNYKKVDLKMGQGNDKIQFGEGKIFINYGEDNQKCLGEVKQSKIIRKTTLLEKIETFCFKIKWLKWLSYKIFFYRMEKLLK